MSPGPAVEFVNDLTPVRWITNRLFDWARYKAVPVISMVPQCYDAYVRLFHPAYTREVDGSLRSVRWDDLAKASNSTVHPEMRFEAIARDIEGIEPPREGTLPQELASELATLLRDFTATPERCFFCVWAGFDIAQLEHVERPRILRVPHRDMVVYLGPIDALPTFTFGSVYQSPNLWWPEDKKYCVGTDIDQDSTFVAGTEKCAEALIAYSRFEALRVKPHSRVDQEADYINQRPLMG